MKQVLIKISFILFIGLFLCLHTKAQLPVSTLRNLTENDTKIDIDENELTLTWSVHDGEQCQLVLNLEKRKPLIRNISMSTQGRFKSIATDLEPVFVLDVGKRTLKPENGWTIFFDKVPTRPYTSHVLDIDKQKITITKQGKRTLSTNLNISIILV